MVDKVNKITENDTHSLRSDQDSSNSHTKTTHGYDDGLDSKASKYVHKSDDPLISTSFEKAIASYAGDSNVAQAMQCIGDWRQIH